MIDTNPKQALRELYVALKDKPLEPKKDTDLYEPYVEKLPDGDPIHELLTGIQFSEVESLHLVSGQRGTGKSTELLRLKQLLEDTEDDHYIVFYLDVLDYLSESEPVEITDFLLAASAGLAKQAQERFGFDALHESYWKRMKNLLTAEVQLEDISLKTGVDAFGVDIKARLKRDASFKKQLQKAARGHIITLTNNVNTFVSELVAQVRKQQKNDQLKIAFIVDSFEQIRGNAQNSNHVHDSMVQLFSSYGENLHLPEIHFVITVPPYLTTAAPGISRLTGSNPTLTLPSLHIRQKDGSLDVDALQVMRSIVWRRSKAATTIFTKKAIDQLAQASGGDLRNFFAMLRTALLKAGARTTVHLPVASKYIDQSTESLRRDMLPISDEEVKWLFRVHTSKKAELPSLEALPALARLFDATLVINYRNGDDWYDIHPLVRDYVIERQATLDQRQ